ncbi:MAG: tail fiber protein [Ramlibacter sp.]|nr:tail fiber protein [Ramlibacter sp.]
MHVVADRVRETTSTTGTGPFTTTGAVALHAPFSSELTADGQTTWYGAQNSTEWEVGLCTRTSATTYARTQVMASSNGGAAVDFTSPPQLFLTVPASAMRKMLVQSVFAGEIRATARATAPDGWALCDGQLLLVADQPELFAAIGNVYGGDGVTDFRLPDLRGRVPVGAGAGAGIDAVALADVGGANSVSAPVSGTAEVALDDTHLPSHTHTASVDSSGLTATPTLLAATDNTGGLNPDTGYILSGTVGGPSGAAIYAPPGSVTTTVPLGGITSVVGGSATASIGSAGGGATLNAPLTATASVDVMPPFLGINYIISLGGNLAY